LSGEAAGIGRIIPASLSLEEFPRDKKK